MRTSLNKIAMAATIGLGKAREVYMNKILLAFTLIAACGIAVAGKPAYKPLAPYAGKYNDTKAFDMRYQKLIGFDGVCGTIDSPNLNVSVCVDSLEKFRDDVSAYRKTIDTLEYTTGSSFNSMTWHKSEDVYYENHKCYAAAEKASKLLEAFNAACQVVVCKDKVINETKKAKKDYEACVKKNGSPFELADKFAALSWLHNTADDMIPEMQRPHIVSAKIGKGVSLGAAISASMNNNMSPEEKAEYGVVPLKSLSPTPSPADLAPSGGVNQMEKAIANVKKGSFTDTRDSKTYKTVEIGTQTWMTENLNYDAKGSKCYGNKPENCAKYGRLYDWNTAKNACPKGWHLPSYKEWNVLLAALCDPPSPSGTYLEKLSTCFYRRKSGNGTDEFGFVALPGGDGNSGGNFLTVGSDGGSWWSASANSVDWVYILFVNQYNGSAGWSTNTKYGSRSVRCLKD